LATDSEITFIVEYDCVRCGTRLEAKSSAAEAWLRCPQCGRASLPPQYTRVPRPRARAPLGDDVLVIGSSPAGASRSGRSGFGPGSLRRISGASALFFLLLTAYFAFLDQFRLGAVVFGLIAFGCLVFAVLPWRRS
jgi:DNA-directed RNA polymerase subunit RPC12/RpoP